MDAVRSVKEQASSGGQAATWILSKRTIIASIMYTGLNFGRGNNMQMCGSC